MVRAGCSGISAAMVSPRAEKSSASSASATSVMEQARSAPVAARPQASWLRPTHKSASSRRIFSGAMVPIERTHYGFLHTCPRRASISSAAAGPHVPAA